MSEAVRTEIRFHHGGLSVPNLDESIEWYARVLGFQVETRFQIPVIPANVAMLRRDSMRIELFQVDGASPLPTDRRLPERDVWTHGNKHVAFAVRDVPQMADELRRLDADIVFVMKHDFGSNIFIRDNAGNLLEFCEQPELWS